jgi:hypothetical protein
MNSIKDVINLEFLEFLFFFMNLVVSLEKNDEIKR